MRPTAKSPTIKVCFPLRPPPPQPARPMLLMHSNLRARRLIVRARCRRTLPRPRPRSPPGRHVRMVGQGGTRLSSTPGPRRSSRSSPSAFRFLDLKFHDIPNTVAGAVRSAATPARMSTIDEPLVAPYAHRRPARWTLSSSPSRSPSRCSPAWTPTRWPRMGFGAAVGRSKFCDQWLERRMRRIRLSST